MTDKEPIWTDEDCRLVDNWVGLHCLKATHRVYSASQCATAFNRRYACMRNATDLQAIWTQQLQNNISRKESWM